MGTLSFQLPDGLSEAARADLALANLAGGYDGTPVPTRVELDGDRLTVRRELDESGYLTVPWALPQVGRLLTATATLMERPVPYQFLVELARGKINQLRNQAAEWRSIGLQVPPPLDDLLRAATHEFTEVVALAPDPAAQERAQVALALGHQAADALTASYVEQLVATRLQREGRLPAWLGCRVAVPPPAGGEEALRAACNCAVLPMTWRQVEPVESHYRWDEVDAVLDWALKNGMAVAAGPLVDFSPGGMPEWLALWENDLPSLASFMCDYVETAVARYRGRVRRWQLTAAANRAGFLSLGEDDLLRLTARLAEAAWMIDPELELVVGLAQPWGEYMADEDHTYSPFVFADTLLRAGLRLAAIDLELFPGVAGRGSFCRDPMEASRLLDLYSVLGVPLQVTCGYPSAAGPDPLATPGLEVGAGHWRDGYTPKAQADWVSAFGGVALCKPFVTSVVWAHLADAEPHLLPHAGLFDAAGQAKPAVARLRTLRQAFLR